MKYVEYYMLPIGDRCDFLMNTTTTEITTTVLQKTKIREKCHGIKNASICFHTEDGNTKEGPYAFRVLRRSLANEKHMERVQKTVNNKNFAHLPTLSLN